MNIYQNYQAYTPEDHDTWARLNQRQAAAGYGKASKEYQRGFDLLGLDASRIVRIDALSKRLEQLSGWTLIPVTGLIPTRDFFYMLINKKYPVNIYLRKPHELDFSEQPDIFHDVYGHIPLLTNEKFYRFLTEFSIVALKYVDQEQAIECLGRLYWYTYEMGLIREEGVLKPYGGAIITSASEMTNVQQAGIPKYDFKIRQIFGTPYNPYKLQQEYFAIESFNDLFDCVKDLEEMLVESLTGRRGPAATRVPVKVSLNANLTGNFNNVIGFLNDVQFRFPQAISFAAGQPDEKFFDVEQSLGKFSTYVGYYAHLRNSPDRQATANKIGQYNKTKGIINEIIVTHLRKDENIHVEADDILITLGAQEAFAVTVSTLCNREEDVILLEDPSYIGISSFAQVFGYRTEAVKTDENGIRLDELENKIRAVSERGLRVKLVYVIPDYQNPTGSSMPVQNRLRLLELAEQYNFFIIEDSVYNSFTYVQKKSPTLKSLDRERRVIYVGSFAKSLFPGLRIGLLVADQIILTDAGEPRVLSDEMAKVKALLTNNTPTITQAILGGVLLDLDYSLSEFNKEKFEAYKVKRDTIIGCLRTCIGQAGESWAGEVGWNEPNGGFFIKVTVPFEVNDHEVACCAEKYGVLYCPMYYFYQGEGGKNEIRLTFSNLSLDQITEGVARFAAYLKERISLTPQASPKPETLEVI